MDSLENYRILLAVVDRGGFSAAAKALGLTTAKVSRAVADIEQHTGSQLLQRTTRRVAMTETGSSFIAQLRPALAQLSDAHQCLGKSALSPVFKSLRVSCCRAGGLGLVAAAAASFQDSQQQLALTLDLHDRPVDPDSEGYDLSLAIGPAVDEAPAGLRPLLAIELAVVASPSYVALHKRPQSPSDLLQHRLLMWSGMPRWEMRDGTQIVSQEQIFSNDLNVILSFCIAASGIALLPSFMLAEELRARTLVQLLGGFEPRPLQLSAKWGHRAEPSAGGAAFLKYLARYLKTHSP